VIFSIGKFSDMLPNKFIAILIIQKAEVSCWHFSAVPTAPSNVGFREKTGRHMLNASSSHFDPERSKLPCGNTCGQAAAHRGSRCKAGIAHNAGVGPYEDVRILMTSAQGDSIEEKIRALPGRRRDEFGLTKVRSTQAHSGL
jgi:hypothetical protein